MSWQTWGLNVAAGLNSVYFYRLYVANLEVSVADGRFIARFSGFRSPKV